MLSRIKVGDQVEVISGKDKGKRGEVLVIEWPKSLVKVRGIALQSRHKKTKAVGKKGAIEKHEAFLSVSKVMPICPKTNLPCRVRVKVLEDGKKVRVSHRSGSEV
jgi:large subunit ribosomal protein L24